MEISNFKDFQRGTSQYNEKIEELFDISKPNKYHHLLSLSRIHIYEIISDLSSLFQNISPDIVIQNIYHVQILFGDVLFFLVIEFETIIEDRNKFKEKINLFFDAIDKCKFIIRKERILSNIAISKDFHSIFEFYNEKTNIQKIQYHQFEKYTQYPFVLEFPVYYPWEYNEWIKKNIPKYYRNKFTNIINYYDKLDFGLAFSSYSIWNFKDSIENEEDIVKILYKIVFQEVWNQVGIIYDRLSNFFIYNYFKFLKLILSNYREFDSYFLTNIKEYFDEFYTDFYETSHPHLFIEKFDSIFLHLVENNSNSQIINFNDKYKEFNKPSYKGIFQVARNVLKIFFKLKTVLKQNISNIDRLIILKQETKGLTSNIGIKYKKKELQEKISKLRNENDFHTLLFDILDDLGFKDINYSHGQIEFGKDIVCSILNQFHIKEWCVFIVKIGDILSKDADDINPSIKNIGTQISKSNNIYYQEKNFGLIKITRIFVITSGIINEHAKFVLISQSKDIEGKLFFIDKFKLLELCN